MTKMQLIYRKHIAKSDVQAIIGSDTPSINEALMKAIFYFAMMGREKLIREILGKILMHSSMRVAATGALVGAARRQRQVDKARV